jgi:hypothetical protein
LVPVSVSEVKVTAPVPVLVIVTVCAAEVEPSAVDENIKPVDESDTVVVVVVVEGQPLTRLVTLTVPRPVASS